MATSVLASGFVFPEGPVFDRAGNLYVTNFRSEEGIISKVTPDGTVSIFAKTGGMPNGAVFGKDGFLYLADAGVKAVLKISSSGVITTFVDRCGEARFVGPNDLVFDSHGNLYFTDPIRTEEARNTPVSSVYRVALDGRVDRFATHFAFPNGIGLSPDETTLYVAETAADRITRIVINHDGSPGPRNLLVQFDQAARPDGMALAEDGTIFQALIGKGVIAVVSPEGKLIAELDPGGKRPTNVAFGGKEFTTLYITETETDTVTICDAGKKGLRLYADR